MNKKPDYLITGANGFLGNVLVPTLKFTSNVVTIGQGTGIDMALDISKPFELTSAVKFDVVVHAAGKAHKTPKTEAEIKEFYDVNLEGTKNLCRALVSAGNIPQSFIFISSVSVYGLDEGELINEKSELKGDTPYAKSKILAEQWLENWAAEHDVILGILRLPLIAGPNPPGNLGSMINGIKKGRYLSIGKADARKSIVWSQDIATILPKVAQTGGTYNLTDGHHPSLLELENCISTALKKGSPLHISYGVAKVLGLIGDLIGKRSPVNSDKIKKLTSSLTFDDSLAVKMLNWSPTQVLDKIASIL